MVICNFDSTVNVSQHPNKNNHATSVIDEFFAARVAGQKGLRPSAQVSRLKKNRSRPISSE
jgi:hypothetical protein